MNSSRHYILKVYRNIQHILLVFTCLMCLESAAQIPWTVQSNGLVQTLKMPTRMDMFADSNVVNVNDALGAFMLDSNGVEVCIGAVLIDDSTSDLLVYGQDSVNGLFYGEMLQFKLYDHLKDCEYASVLVYNDSGSIVFEPGMDTWVLGVMALSANVNYPVSEACQNEGGTLFSNQVVAASYFSTPGLEIDSSGGQINIQASLPNSYPIFVDSDFCLTNDSILVTILKLPSLQIIGDTLKSCAPTVAELSVVTDGSLITWSNLDTTLSTNFPVPGAGYVQVINNDGCSIQDTFELTLEEGVDLTGIEIATEFKPCIDSTSLNINLSLLEPSSYSVLLDGDTLGMSNTKVTTLVASGSYQVTIFNESGCFDSVHVIIPDTSFDQSELEVVVNQPTCNEAGWVEVMLEGDIYPVRISGEDPTQLNPGTYTIAVELTDECTVNWDDAVVLNIPDGCQSEVMYPEEEGADATFYIENAGTTKIIDRSGQVVRSLQTPGLWNGRNDNSEIVPMGEYYIITNDEISITISVIR